MKSDEYIEGIRTDLRRIIGADVYKVIVHQRYVDFIVGGSIHTTIRIKKDFQFTVNSTDIETCCIGSRNKIDVSSCRYINFLGKSVSQYLLDVDIFQILFEDRSEIAVKLLDDELEAIELIGSSGPHGSKLEFSYVL